MNLKRKQETARRNAEERKLIEAALHPNPFFNGLEVAHTHTNKYIRFSAWNGDVPADNNGKRLGFPRAVVLTYGEKFYDEFKDDFIWLTTKEGE